MSLRSLFGYLVTSYIIHVLQGESLGPPLGAAGSIDFRYPDVIVEPLPDCPFEGVFPHPRNCTWYYRCYFHQEGFYRRAYFQCEPGTVFNDALDQCTWGKINECKNGVVTNNYTAINLPCTDCSIIVQSCGDYVVCPGVGNSIPQQLELCTGGFRFCKSCNSSTNVCAEDKLYSPIDSKCHLPPDHPSMACLIPEPPQCDICSLKTDRCVSYQVCPNEGEEKNMILCSVAYSYCLPCQSTENICPNGEYYSVEFSTCVLSPEHPSMKCIQKVPQEPCEDCHVSTSRCRPYEVCPNAGEKVTLTLCSNATTHCLPCGTSENTCKGEEFYSIAESTCYPSPESSSMACSIEPEPVTDSNIIISESSANEIKCSVDSLIPNDDWIKQKYCTPIPLCIDGEFLALPILCTSYYECLLLEGGGWEVKKMVCPAGMLFDLKDEMCQVEPTKEERCDGF